eukprot:gene18445-24152_t
MAYFMGKQSRPTRIPIKGALAVDGAYGFAGVDLVHDDDTLFVGIDPHAEITRDFTTTQMFLPNVGKEYEEVVLSGYVSTLEWANKGEVVNVVPRTWIGINKPGGAAWIKAKDGEDTYTVKYILGGGCDTKTK